MLIYIKKKQTRLKSSLEKKIRWKNCICRIIESHRRLAWILLMTI